jgi:NHLM bacteriocin system secretion protein
MSEQLFRKESLERLSSPERLDQLTNVVDPRAWIPLTTIGSLIIVTIIWSIFGRLPLNVSGKGVLIQPRRVIQFQAPSNGEVLSLEVKQGDRVKKGDVLGTISQSALEQELQQKKDQLAKLEAQNKNTDLLEIERLQEQRDNLALQRANLEQRLKRTEIYNLLRQENLDLLAQNRTSLTKSLEGMNRIMPTLRDRNLAAIAEKKEGLEQRLAQLKNLEPVLAERIKSRQQLLDKQLITGDALLNAERQYFDSLTEISDIEAQLTQIELEKAEIQRQHLENLNQIDEVKNQIQQLDVQETDGQRQYLEGLNNIDEIKARITEIKAEEIKLAEQTLEESFRDQNQIRELKNQIAKLEKELAEKSKIISDYSGRILELTIIPGNRVSMGSRIGVIETEDESEKLISLAYFADKDGKRIEEGMKVQVTPSLVKRERYGGIVGEVTQVSSFPVTLQEMSTLIGNENLASKIAESIPQTGGKAPVQVFAQLEVNANNISGYNWSSSDGPPIQLSSGTTTEVRVKVGELAPISYVIPIFRSITGVY